MILSFLVVYLTLHCLHEVTFVMKPFYFINTHLLMSR